MYQECTAETGWSENGSAKLISQKLSSPWEEKGTPTYLNGAVHMSMLLIQAIVLSTGLFFQLRTSNRDECSIEHLSESSVLLMDV